MFVLVRDIKGNVDEEGNKEKVIGAEARKTGVIKAEWKNIVLKLKPPILRWYWYVILKGLGKEQYVSEGKVRSAKTVQQE